MWLSLSFFLTLRVYVMCVRHGNRGRGTGVAESKKRREKMQEEGRGNDNEIGERTTWKGMTKGEPCVVCCSHTIVTARLQAASVQERESKKWINSRSKADLKGRQHQHHCSVREKESVDEMRHPLKKMNQMAAKHCSTTHQVPKTLNQKSYSLFLLILFYPLFSTSCEKQRGFHWWQLHLPFARRRRAQKQPSSSTTAAVPCVRIINALSFFISDAGFTTNVRETVSGVLRIQWRKNACTFPLLLFHLLSFWLVIILTFKPLSHPSFLLSSTAQRRVRRP